MSQTDSQDNQMVSIELVGFELATIKLIDTILFWSSSRYSVMLSWGLPQLFPAGILNGRDWVNFTSVLTMEHEGMVRMFKTLEDTGLRGFLEGTTPIYESAVVEFFSNARVIAGTIVSTVCGQKLVVTEEFSSGTFKFPTEDLLFEYRLLHDIVAKSLCAKAGSFDKVTCEKFEFMVAISAGISVNWGRLLFQRLLAMVQTPRKQSQGFTVQVSILMELLVRADLGTTNKLHVKKVLTSKQVENYLKNNQGSTPTEETASNTEGGTSQRVPPEVTKSLADAVEQDMPNPKKRKHKGGATTTQTKQAAMTPPDTTAPKIFENRAPVVSTNDDPEEESEIDSSPLKQAGTTHPDPTPALTPEEFPEEEIIQGGSVDNFTTNLDLNDQNEQAVNNDQNENVDHPHQTVPTEGEETNAGDEQQNLFFQNPTIMDTNLSEQEIGEVILEEGLISETQKEHTRQSEPDLVTAAGDDLSTEEPETIAPTTVAQTHPATASTDQYCQSLIASAREKFSAQLTIFEEWAHFRLEVRLKDLSCFQSMVDNEERMLEWQRRRISLSYPSDDKCCLTHYDFECIRQLHQELRLIAAGHRHHRGLAGLPLTTPECDFLPKFSPALEIYNLTGTAQGSVLNTNSRIEQHEDEVENASYEHQAQENESPIPTAGHDLRTQDEQGYEALADEGLNAIPISVVTPDVTTIATENVSGRQDLHSSDLQLIASTSMESPTLELLSTTIKTLTTLSKHVKTIDESYLHLRAYTLMTKHHTAQLHDQLKKTTDEMGIRMNILENTLTERLVDELAVVKSQLAIIVEDLKESGAAKKGEGGSSISIPREGPSGRGPTGGR
ncbi:hypothetical protein F511_22910 [Dorcoceras hygrometricum]|uniref:Dystroglycan-like n=1 Tax=Dorcoceras hygrometricum TaxID=472368 RepID=A0A2Z7BV15_9LAMI|nr:hypothetical protein F511_22910 [Dorcoceras hygrometricum]